MSYRLAKQNKQKGVYLTIGEKFWDKERKNTRGKHHSSLGYLQDL